MAKLRAKESMSALALEFCVLTAARSSEVLGARWDEIDGDCWTISAARMKAAKDHRVPLSTAAMAVLEKVRNLGLQSEFVFPNPAGGTMGDASIRQVLKRLGYDLTVHGFRSTFRDWAADETEYPEVVAEQALAHSVGKVEKAYRRSDLFDRRRAMMDQWARYCS
jgi:integrase